MARRACLLVLLLIGSGLARPGVATEDALWAALRAGRAVALLRHALAPGTGDPVGFRLDDCATQRNLSDEGRAQAHAIGARFRAQGIERAEVYSSRWCRCLETARRLELGPVEALLALDSFFTDRRSGPAQTTAVERFLGQAPADRPRVLVTHQVNITALTGVVPRGGDRARGAARRRRARGAGPLADLALTAAGKLTGGELALASMASGRTPCWTPCSSGSRDAATRWSISPAS